MRSSGRDGASSAAQTGPDQVPGRSNLQLPSRVCRRIRWAGPGSTSRLREGHLYYFDALLSPQTAVSVSQITMLKDKKDRHQTSYHAIQTNTRQIQRETGLAQEFTRICNNALFRLRSLLFAFRNNVPVCLRANVPMCIYARVRVHACVRLRVQARPVAQRSGQRGTFRICKVSCGRHARRYRLKGTTVVVPAACASVVGLLARSSL